MFLSELATGYGEYILYRNDTTIDAAKTDLAEFDLESEKVYPNLDTYHQVSQDLRRALWLIKVAVDTHIYCPVHVL